MNNHYIHNIDPVIFDLGPLQIRWYGLMYVIGFIIAGYLLKVLAKEKFFKVEIEKIDSLVTTMIVCMFLGARFFYVFIYNWDYYSVNMLELLAVWKGGLSFHGALVGLCIGGYIFGRQNKLTWFEVMDCVALSGSQGLFWGRLGNFINGELYGRPTSSFVGIIFPNGGGLAPRHASQLYEAFLEGVLLTLILWIMKSRVKVYGMISAFFIAGYGLFRFVVEFYREPDSQLGYYFGFLTMGQILCFIMIIVGTGVGFYAKQRNVRLNPVKA
ncbi:MAG: prolipoprotein diacylglyceryl transferase [Bacteriovoracaceae bacterium]|nr:prolipoprotein diacylglyceryl transferase [Bacteriovoracaceae bacterium]